MARDVNRLDTLNLWGRSTGSDENIAGLELQRADLWMVDFTIPVNNLTLVSGKFIAPLVPQYAKSVSFPERKVTATEIRRDSMPFNMPSWDSPLGEIKINFWYDSNDVAEGSVVMTMLELWEKVVRAGRGDRGTMYYGEPNAWLTLDKNYRVDFAYDFMIKFLRGNTTTDLTATVRVVEDFRVKQAWLSSYKVTDLSYASGTELVSIECTFYAEDIVRLGDQSNFVGPTTPLPGSP